MKKNNIKPEKGSLLVSAPSLQDIFKRSVILLTEHNEKGSVGFILNKPLKIKLSEVVEDFPEFDAGVFLGGPVQPNVLNVIHRDSNVDGSFEISDGIYWGGNFDAIRLLAETGSLNPDNYRFYLGYAGWSPDQLNDELDTDSWYVNNSREEFIFSENTKNLWNEVLRNMGGEYSIISTFPDDPTVN